MERVDELLIGNERRLVSYSKKRIPCSCLDAKFREVKSFPKMSCCSNPECSLPGNKVEVELSAMMSCGGCRRAHYCSESCQAADWEADHKEECKIWRKWKKTNDKPAVSIR